MAWAYSETTMPDFREKEWFRHHEKLFSYMDHHTWSPDLYPTGSLWDVLESALVVKPTINKKNHQH